MMNVFTCNTFHGYYPVGSAAVMVAKDRDAAKVQLEIILSSMGLGQTIDPDDIKPLNTDEQCVLILDDGNY